MCIHLMIALQKVNTHRFILYIYMYTAMCRLCNTLFFTSVIWEKKKTLYSYIQYKEIRKASMYLSRTCLGILISKTVTLYSHIAQNKAHPRIQSLWIFFSRKEKK